MQTQTDQMLIADMRNGNQESFKILFGKYYPRLCAFACQYVNIEDAREIVQDIMMWFWENRKTFIAEISLQSYLFKMVKHKSLTLISRNEVRQRAIHSLHEKMKDEYENPDFYDTEELTRKINEALNKLPENYRQAFVLHRFHDMTYKEIAEQLNISPKTVDYRICQALKILRSELKDYILIMILLGCITKV